MKRLAAVALVLALSALPACAQRGGSSGGHGGFSGSHGGGFSGSHGGGFSGFHGGSGFHSGSGGFSHSGSGRFRAPSPGRFSGAPPARFGGFPPARGGPMPGRFGAPNPGRFAGPPHYVSNPGYRAPRLNPVGPRFAGPRAPYSGSLHRMPYDGRHGGNGGNGWNHDRGHGWDHDRHRHRDRDDDDFGFVGFNTWIGYPYLPWWGWGYPGLFDNWDSSDNYDSQPAPDSSASQYPEYTPAPYDPQQDEPLPPEQAESQQPAYTPWPYSRPAPSASTVAPPPPPDTPVTLVFKDGRPDERIHNYLLTNSTLSVLDQRRQDIPVDQLDLAATARVNRQAGVDFALPGPVR